MASVSTCLDDDVIGGYLDGGLPEDEIHALESHLAGCESCRQHVSNLAKLPHSLIGEAAADTDRPGTATLEAALALDDQALPGTRVGRYVIQRTIGSGGMGVVWLAHDPELDRDVALKVLHPELWSTAGAEGRARLKREARAMARLTHPNIVAVYDVAMHGKQLVVAMEYVDGTTLDAWCRASRPSWRATLAACIVAGKGLAAAHAGGIIHRDFKPQNILRGRDGRVVVTDFGLARWNAAHVPEEFAAARGRDLGANLTQTGTVMGTPPYMAPEQLTQGASDEQSDQWSYCATTYRLLYGEPAFAGTSVTELTEAIKAGKIAEPPARTEIPAWVRQVLLRGMRVDPAERHGSMTELLAALAKDPAHSRRRKLYGASIGLGAVAIGDVTAMTLRGDATVSCDGSARLHGIWDEPRKQAVRAAFVATGRPYGAETARHVEALLDHQASAVVLTHQQTCEATHVQGSQSAALLDIRMECLDRRVDELAALVDVFTTQPDAHVLDKSITAAAALISPAACANARSPLATTPSDPSKSARVAEVMHVLDRGEALERAGTYPAALAVIESVASEARTLGSPRLHARTEGLLGVIHADMGDAVAAERDFRAALVPATQAGDDIAVAKVWSNLISVIGGTQARIGEGKLAAAAAEAALTRTGDDPDVHANVLTNLASVLQHAGNPKEAVPLFERAVKLVKAVYGEAHPRYARALASLGGALQQLGKFAEARPYVERALAIEEAAVGPDHPELVFHLVALGHVLYRQGDLAKASTYYERAQKIVERTQAPVSTAIAEMQIDLGNLRLEQGKHAEAVAAFTRALEIRQQLLGPDHPALSEALRDLGEAHRRHGEFAEARDFFTRALVLRERVLGPEHPSVAGSLTDVARVLQREGHAAEARPYLERALKIREAALGPDHVDVASTLNTLGIVVEELGDPALAKRHYERGLAILEHALGPDHPDLSTPLNNLGDLAAKQGKYAEARPYFERALRIVTAKRGAKHASLAAPLDNLGELNRLERRCRDALPYYEQALAIWEASLKPGHPNLAHALTGLGRCQLDLGHGELAVTALERALTIRQASHEAPELVGETELALARALIATHRDRARAAKLGVAARDHFAKAGAAATKELAEAAAWVRTHPVR